MAATLTLAHPLPSIILPDHPKPQYSNATSLASNTNLHPAHRLQTCRSMQDVELVHGQLVKLGLARDISAVCKLVTTCAEMGSKESLDLAREVLEVAMDEGVVSLFAWNSVIRGYTFAGMEEEAFLLFVEMLVNGVTPDRFTFPFVVNACARIADLRVGEQVHGALVKMGGEIDVYLCNSLMHFYCECGDLEAAREVFDKMTERNVVSWTTLITGYSRREQPGKAIELFERMRVSCTEVPNSMTMCSVVSACGKLGDLEAGERALRHMQDLGIGLSPILANSLVDLFMKCGDVSRAEQFFHECENKDLVLWNTMMSNYVRLSMPEKGIEVLRKMWQHGVKPDRVTLLAAISACSQLGQLVNGKQCHCFAIRQGMTSWDSVTNSLIDLYMKCDEQETALRIFEEMENKNVVSWNTVLAGFVRNQDLLAAFDMFNLMPEKDLFSWNTLISGLAQDSQFEEAIKHFREMQNSGVNPNRVTMVGVASACGYLGSLELSRWVHAYIKKGRIQCDLQLSTALVDMYARCGDFDSSMQVFHEMKVKDCSAWTSAIGAMAMEGNGVRAIELFNEMVEHGVEPDGVTFVGLLTACSHSGFVEEGKEFFELMNSKYSINPLLEHYGCMVDLLGRAGLLEEAKTLIESMPDKPNYVIWGSLLAACRLHNNLDLAVLAANKIVELAPDKTGLQVLLSNVFASAGKWDDVVQVRLNMFNSDIRKHPGSSSIQMDGSIHEFTSGDEYHPQMSQIAVMLNEMNERLKSAGYVPDLTNVLLDVDLKEKHHLLSRHSEKLAMAYGLISTVQGNPVRITKNLRMCTDCHSFAKLVSDIYKREIVIRDNNRFHFFQHGKCSCLDYW